MHRRVMLVLSSCWFLAACGGSDNGSGPSGQSGSMSFNFSGAASGSFSAQGTINNTANPTTTANWAGAYIDEQDGALVVEGLKAGSGGTFDFAAVFIPRTTAGSSTVDVNCSANVCAEVIIEFGVTDAGDFVLLCFFESGTLTISTISDSRATGTFNGSGGCIDNQLADAGTLTVTGGTFDVAIFGDIAVSRAAP